jgi:hydroxyacylglutathione hydrolase
MPVTTLGYEKLANWAFQERDEKGFVDKVLQDQPDPPRYFAEMKRVNRIGTGTPAAFPEAIAPEALVDVLSGDGQSQIVDLRSSTAFAAGFIPGTISLPLDKGFLNYAGALLYAGQKIYLIGPDESAVREAVSALSLIGLDQVAGWADLKVLDCWSQKHHELAAMEQLTVPQWQAKRKPRQVLLDVRANTEFRSGHIPGAMHIPLGRLPERASRLPADSEIVVHCQGGVRSPIALSVLVKMGFRNVANLSGGFQDYQRSGLPVETGA